MVKKNDHLLFLSWWAFLSSGSPPFQQNKNKMKESAVFVCCLLFVFSLSRQESTKLLCETTYQDTVCFRDLTKPDCAEVGKCIYDSDTRSRIPNCDESTNTFTFTTFLNGNCNGSGYISWTGTIGECVIMGQVSGKTTCDNGEVPSPPSPTPIATLSPKYDPPLRLSGEGILTDYRRSTVSWDYQIVSGTVSDPTNELYYVELAICDLFANESRYQITTHENAGTLVRTSIEGIGTFYTIRWEGIFDAFVSVTIAGSDIVDQTFSEALSWYFSVVGTEEGIDPKPVKGPGCFDFVCLLNCGDHGECVLDPKGQPYCSCDDYFEGDDCSLYTYPLEPLVPVFGDVDKTEWKYFTFESYGLYQSWVLTVTSGDCDLYVNYDNYPSRDDFISRNQSSLPELTITLNYKDYGVYYGGVYGYTSCSFSIRASYCNSCGEYGSCFDGECVCNAGYGGEYCDLEMVQLVAHGSPFGASAAAFEWTYFYFESDEEYSEVAWIVESEKHNAMTLALREGEVPTFWNNDAMVEWFRFSQKAFINQTYVQKGTTSYFGVLGGLGCGSFGGNCEFTIRLQVTTTDNCPNACSLHSSGCHGASCVCLSGYSGIECEEYTRDTQLGVTYTGFVGGNAWNYYHIVGNSAESYVVELDLTSSRKECELYVNGGSKPTLREFSYLDTSQPARIVIPEPIGETWYIGIYGRTAACTYNLKTVESKSCGCAPHPTGHGSCEKNSAICVCDDGWVGDDCSEAVKEVKSGVPVRGESVGKEEWNYYFLDSKDSSAFSLTLREINTTGLVWLFISHSEYPTLNSFDYSDKSTDSPVHEVTFFTREPQSGQIYLGVFGSPFIPQQTPKGDVVKIPYDLEAWESNF